MKLAIFIVSLLTLCFTFGGAAFAQSLSAFGLPAVTSVEELSGETTYSLSLQILLLMTALTVLPSLVLGMTAFTRIIIVLSILRQALGTQQTPPNQVLIAVALFLSFYVMSIGDNIIIPSDIKIEAITISITRNGRKIKKPISNAVFSSDVINAGNTIDKGIDFLSSKGPLSDISVNIFNVSIRVLETMNSFIMSKP